MNGAVDWDMLNYFTGQHILRLNAEMHLNRLVASLCNESFLLIVNSCVSWLRFLLQNE